MSEIKATGSLRDDVVIATLTLGESTLTLTFPRDDEQAAEDMSRLVVLAEDSFARVLEALVAAAEETGADA